MRRYQRLATLTHLLLLVMLVVNTFAPAILVNAQETTPDAPPPVETTPETTPVAPPTETPTESVPTETPVVIPPQNPPATGNLFLADFNTSDTSAFLTSGEWAVIGESLMFATSSMNATAIPNGLLWEDFILVTSVTIGAGGEAVIGLRVGAESYAVRISDSGNATLWRGETLLGGIVPPLAESTPDPLALAQQFEVAISAVDGTISVAVNNVTQINVIDLLPLIAGYVVFGTSATNAGSVGYDNILIQAQVPVSNETPVAPIETPIVIPPLDPTPEQTPVVEITETPVAPTEIPAESTEAPVESTEVPVEITPELTPDVELTPELTPDVELTPEVTETPLPLSLADAEIAKLQGEVWGLLEAYFGGDVEGAKAFAENRYIRWLEDERLEIWVYPALESDIPAVTATLLELGAEVGYLGDYHIDVTVTLDTIVTLARDARISAITLPVFATPTSAETPAQNGIGTPQLLAATGTGSVIPHSLDMMGISSWHEANVLGAGVNIAVIDTGFTGVTTGGERACLGSATVTGGVGTGNHGLNVVEILCDVAPSSSVWLYTATDANTLATRINEARAGGQNGFPAAQVILVTMNPSGNPTALQNAVSDAFNNNVPVIASAGNGGGGKNNVTFSFAASGTTKVFITARAGDVITLTYTNTTPDNTTVIQQVNGSYSSSNMGAGTSHQYIVGGECGDGCQLELTIVRNASVTNYNIASNWANAVITPDATVTLNAGATQIVEYANNNNVFTVGSVCGTQSGRFPLTSTSPRGSASQTRSALIKPDIVAPTNVNTSLIGGANVNTDYTCSGGFTGSSASAAHVAGMAALVISNSNMYGIHDVTSGRPWQLFSYLKSRALDVNQNGFDAFYGAGVAQLGDPTFNLQFERTLNLRVDKNGLTDDTTLYVASDKLSDYNILDMITVLGVSGVPTGTFDDPFIHISAALNYAANNPNYTHIVLLPGEYTTGFNIPPIDGLSIFGFDFADSGDHLPSRIWVSDTSNGSGISIIGLSDFIIAGLDFYSAKPDYTTTAAQMDVARISPLSIHESGIFGPIILNNNQFFNFDAPVRIEASQNVTLRENTFSNFSVQNTAQAAALVILTSGTTTPIAVERNLFTNNIIPELATEYRNTVVMIDQSQARLYGNRLVNNTAPSVVTITMWEDYQYPNPSTTVAGRNILFSNVIANNTTTGPLVHLAQGDRFQFINNTVANNIFNTGNNNLVAIIGLGRATESNGSFGLYVAGTHRFDIHNNLFFANRTAGDSALALKLVTEVNNVFGNFTCTALGPTDSYARFNWFISTGAGFYQGGECSNAGTPTATQGNLATILTSLSQTDRDTFANANFFTSLNDPNHPYRLRPDATSDGVSAFVYDPTNSTVLDALVVTGNASTEILTSKNPSTDTRALDALGNPRFVRQSTPTFEFIDYGAYELSEPDPIEFFDNTNGFEYNNYNAGSFDFYSSEDGVATIDMIRMVRLGFKPYTVEIVPNVTIYDTDPLNQCNGQPYLYDPASYILTYCPPDNFHNLGIADPLAGISFDYRVTGLFNTGTVPASGYATVNIIVNAVDDGNVTAATQRHGTDLVSTLQVDLRPRYDFEPFSLVDASGVDNLDYPFTFSMFTETSDPQNLLDGPNLASMISNGVFTYTPPSGAVQGIFEFTYRATDQDGDFATRTVRVRVVDRILTQGLHDNTALGVVYSGTWTPVFSDPSYQKSLHSTTDTNAVARFNFTGDNFAIGYTGNNGTASSITIELDAQGNNTFTNVYSTAGVTCTAVTPAAGNPIQTAVSGRVFIRCSGIESIAPGEVHTVRINNDSVNAFRLDWVQVDGQPLTVGTYEDTDLRPYMSNMTYTPDALSPNGSWEVFGAANSQISFSVDASVKRIKIFRALNLFRDDLTVTLSGPACTTTNVTVLGLGPELMWSVPQTVQLNGCTNIVIKRTFTAGKTEVNGVDKIELLGAATPLGVGTYHTADLNEFAMGRSGQVLNSAAQDGRFYRLMDGVFRFDITDEVESLVIYRQDYNWRDSLEIKTLNCGSTSLQQTIVTTNTNPVATFGQPIVVNNIGPCTRIEMRRLQGTGLMAWAVLAERMELRSTNTGVLPIGYYDNLNLAPYFSGSGTTTVVTSSTVSGGTWHRFEAGGSITFTVANDVERIMVHRHQGLTRDNLVVALSNGCTTPNVTIGGLGPIDLWNQTVAVNLNGCKTITITRANVAGQIQNGIDGITLLGAAQVVQPGTYHTSTMREFMYGRNAATSEVNAQGGIMQRLMDGQFVFNVAPEVETMILYRQDYNLRDSVQIRTLAADCTNPADATTLVTANTSTVELWGQPIVFPVKSCNRIEITRLQGTGASAWAVILENVTFLEATPATLGLGEYDDLELISRFTNATLLTNSSADGGTWHRINAGGSMTFNVTDDVKLLTIVRPMDFYRDDLLVTLSNTCNSATAPITAGSLGPVPLWAQQFTIDLNGCNTVLIQKANTAGRTDSIGIDGIILRPTSPALSVGSYHTSDLRQYMFGRNASTPFSLAQDGIMQRLMDGVFRFNIDQNVDTLVLYRQNYNWRDSIRIDTDTCTNPGDAKTNLVFSNPNPTDSVYNDPIVVSNIGSCTRVTIQRLQGTGLMAWAAVIERMELLVNPQPTLTSGNLYQEFSTGLSYAGSWENVSFTDIPSRRISRTNALNASVTFTVTGNGFIVYHRASSAGSNNIRVCVTTGANPAVCTNYSIQSATTQTQFPVGIYGLGNGTHTVTITNLQASGYLTLDAIRIP